jgi:hypothetical protein
MPERLDVCWSPLGFPQNLFCARYMRERAGRTGSATRAEEGRSGRDWARERVSSLSAVPSRTRHSASPCASHGAICAWGSSPRTGSPRASKRAYDRHVSSVRSQLDLACKRPCHRHFERCIDAPTRERKTSPEGVRRALHFQPFMTRMSPAAEDTPDDVSCSTTYGRCGSCQVGLQPNGTTKRCPDEG